jgi:hypothetical protein
MEAASGWMGNDFSDGGGIERGIFAGESAEGK